MEVRHIGRAVAAGLPAGAMAVGPGGIATAKRGPSGVPADGRTPSKIL